MLRDIRTNYQKFELTEESVNTNPLHQLGLWLKDAISGQKADPTAMVLSTVDLEGNPDSRVVLLKELTPEGLVFFTNYNSKKGQQITANQHVSVVFFWPELERQVRITGKAEKISEEDSESYFLSRPLESQLGAWASPQSEIIENRNVLDENYTHFRQYFETHEIEKPPHWGGFLIRPEYFEFWQGRSNRLHDRVEFCQKGQNWIIHRLAP
ncbi:MAG: pyridoxamine 5'-phosphate oxidase [Bacteroidota bacterium]|nr:pyridoxamine 5'-phosphate oxidase [Bacteroidota bacterium]MDP3433036.1 pyridoxamine 5'-phosphate oxidase [Bacteroidota bacterium]